MCSIFQTGLYRAQLGASPHPARRTLHFSVPTWFSEPPQRIRHSGRQRSQHITNCEVIILNTTSSFSSVQPSEENPVSSGESSRLCGGEICSQLLVSLSVPVHQQSVAWCCWVLWRRGRNWNNVCGTCSSDSNRNKPSASVRSPLPGFLETVLLSWLWQLVFSVLLPRGAASAVGSTSRTFRNGSFQLLVLVNKCYQ